MFMYGILAAAYLLSGPMNSHGQSPDDEILVLDEVVQQVIDQNPRLQSFYENWRASETRISQSEALPDPWLGLNLMNLPVNSFTFDQEPMTGKQLTVMQKFPWPGTLDLKGDIARSEAEMANLQYQELKNQLVRQAKQTYYDLFYIDRAIETILRNQEVLREFVQIAETKYSVGEGLQQDVLRAQVAWSKMMDREVKLRQKRESVQARLNALVNESADRPLGQPVASDQTSWSAPLDSLTQLASTHNPLLASWNIAVQRSEQHIDLALLNRNPNFSVGMAYTQRSQLESGMGGTDFLSAMFNVSIPIYRKQKQDKNVQEQRIRRTSVDKRYRDAERSIEQQMQQALTEIDKNRRLIDLYTTGIIPQAEESLESNRAGYQNDQVDFLSLLDSELTLFNFQLDYYRILADYHKAKADIEALTSTDFNN